ncbi:hypothetical protein LJC44_02990 [Parabacteroides sp. OttesenSCG-928-G06]|nr:hypothetical protein [Parabacteroides sp. OttesenSCG-928-G06]
MRFLNVLLAVSLLFATAACSMEDDMLTVSAVATSEANDDNTQLYVSFNVSDNAVATRASSSENAGEQGDVIASASLIVFEGNQVYFAQDGIKDFSAVKVLFQTNRSYVVYVIDNAATAFSAMKTKEAVDAAVLNADDMNNNVKFGQASVSYAKGQGYATIAEAKAAAAETATIEVKQLTAKVELKEYTIKVQNGTNASSVKLEKVELVNQSVERTLNAVTGSKFETAEATPATEGTIASFSTFPNENGQTAMRLTIKVGDNTVVKEYVINPNGLKVDHNYVRAGHIYQLYVTATVNGDNVDCAVKCCTLDWDYNSFEVSVVEL